MLWFLIFQASQRQLAPAPTEWTPQELLMNSIRSGEGREALKKTAGPPEPKTTFLRKFLFFGIEILPNFFRSRYFGSVVEKAMKLLVVLGHRL